MLGNSNDDLRLCQHGRSQQRVYNVDFMTKGSLRERLATTIIKRETIATSLSL